MWSRDGKYYSSSTFHHFYSRSILEIQAHKESNPRSSVCSGQQSCTPTGTISGPPSRTSRPGSSCVCRPSLCGLAATETSSCFAESRLRSRNVLVRLDEKTALLQRKAGGSRAETAVGQQKTLISDRGWQNQRQSVAFRCWLSCSAAQNPQQDGPLRPADVRMWLLYFHVARAL